MRVRIEGNKTVVVEFPLTQPKRSWKIRTNGKKSADKIFGHIIQKQDFLEWMVDYSELRDILCCLRQVSLIDFQDILQKFNKIRPTVEKPEDASRRAPIKAGSVIVERKFLGKQYKPTELFPYVFVLMKLFYESTSDSKNIYLIDRNEQMITNTNGQKIKCGDTLIWLPAKKEISKIVEEFAILSKKHKDAAKKVIFDRIEDSNF
jgi:hypothetical protein